MSESQESIYPISSEVLGAESLVQAILTAKETLYWSREWDSRFYIRLAELGFITTAIDYEAPDAGDEPLVSVPLLIPEIQEAYAVLDWENRHIGRTLRRWMQSSACTSKNYKLIVGCNLSTVVEGIRKCHQPCWLIEEYEHLLEALMKDSTHRDFELIPVGLEASGYGIVAGEIGYRIGRTYTSLTGFLNRENHTHNHAGKLQMHLLAEHLEALGIAFWNLGHPGMQYKLDLGARVLPRKRFLQRWQKAVKDEL